MPDNIVRSLWSSRLPAAMQSITNLATVAELGDTVSETVLRQYVAEATEFSNRLETRTQIFEMSTSTNSAGKSTNNNYRSRARCRSKSRST